MYASLGKVDLGVSFEGEAGETVHAFVQTDHRSALEISNDGAFSALFAIARCLAARALAIVVVAVLHLHRDMSSVIRR